MEVAKVQKTKNKNLSDNRMVTLGKTKKNPPLPCFIFVNPQLLCLVDGIGLNYFNKLDKL